MQEIAKSWFDLSWGLSLLGAQQIAGAFTSTGPSSDSTVKAAGCVSQSLGDGVFYTLYTLGDSVGGKAVGLAFRLLPLDVPFQLFYGLIQSVAPPPGWGPVTLPSPSDAHPAQG